VKLILVRHGETATNRDGRGLGHADPPLTDLGLRQAAATADQIAGRLNEPVAAIYTSPFRRARETAALIAERLGHPAAEVIDGLREMDIGAMEGLTGAEMRANHPAFFAEWTSVRAGEVEMPGGESLAAVQARAWPAVEQLLAAHPEQTVVAVSHNFTLHTLICRVLAVPLAEFRQFRLDLASISTVEFRPQRTIVSSLNEVCHLDGLAGQAAWSGPLSGN
jgi:broad specificity phosphatase PhoE